MKTNKPTRSANDAHRAVGADEIAAPQDRSSEARRDAAGALPAGRPVENRASRTRAGERGRARTGAWAVYLALGSVAAFGFFLLSGSDHGIFYDFFYDLVGISATVAILIGVRLNRPNRPLPWHLFALGQLMFVAGDLSLNFYENVLRVQAPFPSISDVFWLAAYPILVVGLVMLIRSRAPGRDWAGLIDATIIATGMGVVSWVFLMNPYTEDHTLSLLERSISIAYPLADVLLLAVVARLAVTPGARTPAYRLLGLSLMCLLIADTIYAKMLLDGTYHTGSLPDLGFLLSYVFWAAAALHPTMGTLSEPAPDRKIKLTWTRLALLAGASLTALGVRAIQAVRGEPVDVPVIIGGSAVLFLLVIARMANLVHKHERTLTRERVLRRAGAALVAAPNLEGIYEAALRAVLELVGDPSETRASLAVGSDEEMVVVAAAGDRAAEARDARIEPGKLPDPICSGLLGRRSAVAEHTEPANLREAFGFGLKTGTLFVSPLLTQNGFKSAFVVDTDLALPEEFEDGLEALSSQVALALESEALAEDLHERRSEERFRSLVQNASDLILILGAEGDLRYVSPSVERVLGRAPEEAVGANALGWVHADDVATMRDALSECARSGEPTPTIELRLSHADGTWRFVELVGNNQLDEPTVGGIVFNARDITERERANARLREAEDRYRTLVERIPAVTYIELADGSRESVYVSPQIEAMVGYAPGEWLATDAWEERLHPDDRERVQAADDHSKTTGEPFGEEYRLIHRDGHVVWIRDEMVLVEDSAGRPRFWQGIVSDVTERKALEERLAHQAFHDPLTGLPNRALFMDRLEHSLARVARQEGKVTMLFLDLDEFKVVNDSLGHKVGDRLLVAVAERLLCCVRPGDTVARLGGDEFTVLLEDGLDANEAVGVAERISEELRAPFDLEGHEIVVTTSIGISFGEPGKDLPEGFLRNADVAMYEAKNKGKARYEVFNPGMDARALERLRLESDMRRALREGEFRVHYQPLIDLHTGKISEVEALVRWEHPERGLMPPNGFIPLAEKTGLIVPIGRWVLTEACEQVRRWQEQLGDDAPLALSVNLSPEQFKHPGLVEDASFILGRTGLDPRNLKLEITEGVVMEDAESNVSILERLKGVGVRLAIDDFGTGYSSLSYLKRFPVDVLKIDKSFVEGLGRVREDTAVVRATVALAKSLGLSVTAEGIETAGQLLHVQALGCDLGQGFHLCRPLPAERVGELLLGGFRLLAKAGRRTVPSETGSGPGTVGDRKLSG